MRKSSSNILDFLGQRARQKSMAITPLCVQDAKVGCGLPWGALWWEDGAHHMVLQDGAAVREGGRMERDLNRHLMYTFYLKYQNEPIDIEKKKELTTHAV